MVPTAAPPLNEVFGARVADARQARGLNRFELATVAHTGLTHIIEIETGTKRGKRSSKVLITTIWKLAAGLGLPPSWLVFGGGPVPERVAVAYDELVVRRAFAARTRFARLHVGLTQGELGDRLGIDRVNVGTIERGIQGATLQSLHNYVRALGMPGEWLMDITEEIEPWD